IDIADAVDGDASRVVESRTVARSIRAAHFVRRPADGRYNPIRAHRCHFSDGAVAGIRDIEISSRIDGNALRLNKSGYASQTIGAARLCGRTGDGSDDPVCPNRGDFPNGIAALGDVEITRPVHGDPLRL